MFDWPAARLASELVQAGAFCVLAIHCGRATWLVAATRSPDLPRRLVLDGMIACLGWSLGGTLLKLLSLQGWQALGNFAAILALRTLLKRLAVWEARALGAERLPPAKAFMASKDT